MKIKLKIEKEYNVKLLQVDAEVRYYDDAEIDGVEDDKDNPQMPCVEGLNWKPLIDIETGVVLNWTPGVKAHIHYKVCDQGIYSLLDEKQNVIIKKDGYVPDILSPNGRGYGDYIQMNIDENGNIDNWKVDLDYFTEEEEK